MKKCKNGWLWVVAGWTGLVGLSCLALNVWPGAAGQGGLFKLSLTPEGLSMLLAGTLALVFDWFPGLAPRYDSLSRIKKQQVMIGMLSLVVALVFAGACQGWFETGLACSTQSLPVLLEYILMAAGANQAVHLLTKPSLG